MTRRRPLPAVAVGLAAVALVAGCSNAASPVSKNPHSGVGTATVVHGVQQITLTTGPDLRFHPATFVVHPGRVRVTLASQAGSGPLHNLQAARVPGEIIPAVSPGQRASTTFTAPSPGRYQFVCTFHEAEGQTGTMIVKPGS